MDTCRSWGFPDANPWLFHRHRWSSDQTKIAGPICGFLIPAPASNNHRGQPKDLPPSPWVLSNAASIQLSRNANYQMQPKKSAWQQTNEKESGTTRRGRKGSIIFGPCSRVSRDPSPWTWKELTRLATVRANSSGWETRQGIHQTAKDRNIPYQKTVQSQCVHRGRRARRTVSG